MRILYSKLIISVKALLFILFVIIFANLLSDTGSFYRYRDYSLFEEYSEPTSSELSDVYSYSSHFSASGNYLNNVYIYYGDSCDKTVLVELTDGEGELISSVSIETQYLHKNEWNPIGLQTNKIKRDNEYNVIVSSLQGLDGLYQNKDSNSDNNSLVIGLDQTYKYMPLFCKVELSVKILCILLYLFAFTYILLEFESLLEDFKNCNRKGGLYSLYFTVFLILFFNPLASIRNKVDSFERIFGQGTLDNVDVNKRIDNFSLWLLAFGVVFISLYMLVNHLIIRTENNTKSRSILSFLDLMMILANCMQGIYCFSFFATGSTLASFSFSHYFIFIILVIIMSYVFGGIYKNVSIKAFEQLVAIALCCAYVFAAYIGKELGTGQVLLGLIVCFLIVVVISCLIWKKKIDNNRIPLSNISLLLAFVPLMISCYVELIHILNQHCVYISKPERWYRFGCIILLIVIAFYVFNCGKRRFIRWRGIAYPALIAGIACLGHQIPISSVYSLNVIEDANASILMSDFLKFSDIPIVEHYGGHMMYSVWEGLLYSFLNNDYSGVASPYSGLASVFTVLFVYAFLAKLWNRETACLISIFMPMLEVTNYYGMGLIVCLVVASYLKQKNILSAVILGGSLVFCAIYRLDLGFAFGVAAVIALCLYSFIYQDFKSFRLVFVSLCSWGIICALFWTVLCRMKGVDALSRVREFLAISQSNQNWAYSGIGDLSRPIVAWVYIILPFMMILTLLHLILSRSLRVGLGEEKWIMLLILNLSYFANFSRGLVRHSLAENITFVAVWSSYLVLPLLLGFIKKNMKLVMPLLTVILILDSILLSENQISYTSAVEYSCSTPVSIIESWNASRFCDEEGFIAHDGSVHDTIWELYKYDNNRVQRVVLSDTLESYSNDWRYVLDHLLTPTETYVDLCNRNLLYSVLGRECPVYVSQSPMQISGEYPQECFIEQIDGIPIVLLPCPNGCEGVSNSMDFINSDYRYYLIFEYVYKNYVPLCRINRDTVLWCLPEKYDDYSNIICECINENPEIDLCSVDYGYDGPDGNVDVDGTLHVDYIESYHDNSLYDLPLIWAEFDEFASLSNPELCALTQHGDYYIWDSGANLTPNGAYLRLSATYYGNDDFGNLDEDDEESSAVVVLGDYCDGTFIERYRYSFNISEGEHDYLIRCSSDYNWYAQRVNSMCIISDGEVIFTDIQLLLGD